MLRSGGFFFFNFIITGCPLSVQYIFYTQVLRHGKVTPTVMSYKYFVVWLPGTLSKKAPLSWNKFRP